MKFIDVVAREGFERERRVLLNTDNISSLKMSTYDGGTIIDMNSGDRYVTEEALYDLKRRIENGEELNF